jgi:hypothetical protein
MNMRSGKRYLLIIVAIGLLALGVYIAISMNQVHINKTTEQKNHSSTNEKSGTGNAAEKTNKEDYSILNGQLSNLLPEKENFKWVYNGFAEYAHIMTLKSIGKSTDQIKYEVAGAVEDMSGGESGKPKDYFNLKITYIIKQGVLIQNKSEKAMMDSIFDSIELIRAPLSKNSKWTQSQTDKTGKKYTLECEITDINDENGIKVYSIRYKDNASYYYETRKIKEGIGVVSFQKPWKDESGNQYELGYTLYEEASGYK